MITTLGAERAPHISFDLDLRVAEASAAKLNTLAMEAELLTLDALTPEGRVCLTELAMQPEGQSEDESSNTYRHSCYVGGLAVGALREISRFPTNELRGLEDVAAVCGVLHDIGKGHDAVRELITLPRVLTDDERATVGLHTLYGQEYIEQHVGVENDEGRALRRIAAAVAYGHHRPYKFDLAVTRNTVELHQAREEAEYTGLIRIADRCQAVFLDWGRPYKADRLTREGILTAEGELDVAKAVEAVMQDDVNRAYYGVRTDELVDYARQFMPSPEWIREALAKQRENTQRFRESEANS